MNERLEAAIKEFLDLEDPMEKYELLFEYADELDELEVRLVRRDDEAMAVLRAQLPQPHR